VTTPLPQQSDDPAGTFLWQRPESDRAATRLDQFARLLHERGHGPFEGYDDLHTFSVEQLAPFWDALWDFAGVVGEKGKTIVAPADQMQDTRFFPEATLNFAKNILGRPSDETAIIFQAEVGETTTRTRAQMHTNVANFQDVLRAAGVGVGDRVAAWMPNIPEVYEVMLAAAGLGAVFSSASPDFGVDGVVDRFSQIEPKILFAANAYIYNGKPFDCLERLAQIRPQLSSVGAVKVLPYVDGWSNDISAIEDAELLDPALAAPDSEVRTPHFEQLPFDHPVFVLYSSGTTGKPKSIVHRAGGVLLTHLKEHQLHNDIRPADRVFYFTTTGWMMWNWLATVLASDATIVVYDGNPAYPSITRLFDMADELGITLLGTSAKFLESAKKAGISPKTTHGLDTVRSITSTGSPLSPEGFAWVYDEIASHVHLASMSGGTDLCGCLVCGDPNGPVHAGEIQCAALGMNMDVVDANGTSVPTGEQGELVCRSPFPSMPLTFWGDDGDARYRSAYFERFPGMWHQGDYAEWTPRGGMIIHGRSDATLNPGGVRIGTAEIYRLVEDIEEVLEAMVIGQQWESDTRIVLFVRMQDDHELTDELQARIRSTIRAGATPRHVPAKIVAVADIPRTRSGKLTEIAVRDIVHGRTIANVEAIANPEALALFKDLPDLSS